MNLDRFSLTSMIHKRILFPLLGLLMPVVAQGASLMLQYSFDGNSLAPTTTTDSAVLTGSSITGDLPPNSFINGTTAIRRVYYDNWSHTDADTTLGVQTNWGTSTPLFRVQSASNTLESSIANNASLNITLNPQELVSLSSLAFDVAVDWHPSYPVGLAVRSSVTGTANLFVDHALAGMQGAPQFVDIDLTSYNEFSDLSAPVTFSFYLYASENVQNIGLDNISFYAVPEPSAAALLGLGAAGFLVRRRRRA